jgi:hypothetical protein
VCAFPDPPTPCHQPSPAPVPPPTTPTQPSSLSRYVASPPLPSSPVLPDEEPLDYSGSTTPRSNPTPARSQLADAARKLTFREVVLLSSKGSAAEKHPSKPVPPSTQCSVPVTRPAKEELPPSSPRPTSARRPRLCSVLMVPNAARSSPNLHAKQGRPASTSVDALGQAPPHFKQGSAAAPHQEWQVVRRRKWSKKLPQPQPQRPACEPSQMAQFLRKRAEGRCFCCLAKDHRAAECRDPFKCLLCFNSDHHARHCPSVQQGLNRSSHLSLRCQTNTFPAIHHHVFVQSGAPLPPRLAFPPCRPRRVRGRMFC